MQPQQKKLADTFSDKRLEIDQSISDGVLFLLDNYVPGVGWSDFPTNSSGESTIWVTSHVLVKAGRLLPRNLIETIIDLLIENEWIDGGWGFSPRTPPDCDSTLHVLLAIRKFRPAYLISQKTRDFLRAHQKPDGGFSTYKDDSVLSKFRASKRDKNYSGWTQSHVCVTGFAAKVFSDIPELVSNDSKILMNDYLLKNQSKTGYWDSYWWRSRFFATAMIIDAFSKSPRSPIRNASLQAEKWALNKLDPAGFWDNGYDFGVPCIISTAMCMRVLRAVQLHYETRERCMNWILKQQKMDGSWQSKPILQIPFPNETTPGRNSLKLSNQGVGSTTRGEKNIYATAVVLDLLCSI